LPFIENALSDFVAFRGGFLVLRALIADRCYFILGEKLHIIHRPEASPWFKFILNKRLVVDK
jgi:hypothetical protein